jgi:hypothetical protein
MELSKSLCDHLLLIVFQNTYHAGLSLPSIANMRAVHKPENYILDPLPGRH